MSKYADFYDALDKFAKKYFRPPWNVNSAGPSDDEHGQLILSYSLREPLGEGLEIEKEFCGFKTRLGSIGNLTTKK